MRLWEVVAELRMTENLQKLAKALEVATPDGILERKILRNAATIRTALETKGEFVIEDDFGNSYRITPKNGNIQVNKSE